MKAAMRQFMTVMALAAFGAMVVTAQAEKQTPSPSTVAAKKRAVSKATNSYGVCEQKAHDIGLVPGQAGRIEYIYQCMGGSAKRGVPHN